jgi:hypothetical protein
VYIGDEKLEKRDFYTNYEFIQKDILSYNDDNNKTHFNVLDYLHDYQCVDLIDKNKFCQSICHWSLTDNNDYIFNVYNGFSGINIKKDDDKTVYYENNHQYGNTPNLYIEKNVPSKNTINWINVIDKSNDTTYKYPDFYKDYILQYATKLDDATLLYNQMYINNVKY